MTDGMPGVHADRERVVGLILRELTVDRSVWESRQLIDALDDETSPMEADLVRDRASRSLEHLFTLMALIYPTQTLRLAFQGLHTADPYLRGTALEYLETVLPEPIWSRLWPLVEEGQWQPARPRRSADEALQELLASRMSISAALAKGGGEEVSGER